MIFVIACLNLRFAIAVKRKTSNNTKNKPLLKVNRTEFLKLEPWPITDENGKLFLPSDYNPMVKAAKYLNMTIAKM